jgi:hypothetical protein
MVEVKRIKARSDIPA